MASLLLSMSHLTLAESLRWRQSPLLVHVAVAKAVERSSKPLTAARAAALPGWVHAESTTQSAETLVGEFYRSLSDQQRKVICLPFNNELMHRVNANWHVTKPVIGDDFYSDAQRTLIEQIVRSVTSEAGHQRLQSRWIMTMAVCMPTAWRCLEHPRHNPLPPTNHVNGCSLDVT